MTLLVGSSDRKIVPEMTYVSIGTLNPTIPLPYQTLTIDLLTPEVDSVILLSVDHLRQLASKCVGFVRFQNTRIHICSQV